MKCTKCQSENTYNDGLQMVCPECGYEWNPDNSESDLSDADSTELSTGVKDAFGQILQSGDSVTVIKELKIKGASSVVKVGTKVKNIRLVDGGDGHDISCKIDGLGSINLKSEFVKKA